MGSPGVAVWDQAIGALCFFPVARYHGGRSVPDLKSGERIPAMAKSLFLSLSRASGVVLLLGLLVGTSCPAEAQTSRAAASGDSRPASGAEPASTVDAAAARIVNGMQEAMGGADAFKKIRTLRFTFAFSSKDTVRTSRTHWWDRQTDQYRIQGVNRKGQTYVILYNTATGEGDAWVDGTKQEAEDKTRFMDRAKGLWINDTYWLLMPWKLFDPGVHLAMDGEAQVNGSHCDRVQVTFDKVGLTPGDTYWAYIDRKSHLMIRWGIIQESEKDKPDVKESLYDWTDWRAFGPIKLSAAKRGVSDPDKAAILMTHVEAGGAFPAGTFTDPKPISF